MNAKIQKIEVVIGQLRDSFCCPICLELMKNAVSTKCDHKFCRHCLMLTLGKKQSAQCPLCKESFTKRSLQPLPQWNSLVNQVGSLITAFERDTGVQFSPKKSALPPSPLCSQQSISSSSQTLTGGVPKCEIYIEDIAEEPLKNNPTQVENTNVNVRSGFPRRARKTATTSKSNNDQLVKCIEAGTWSHNQGNDDEQVVPNTRSTRNKSVPCNLAAFLETATESQLGGTEHINLKVTAKKTKRSGKSVTNKQHGSSNSSSATSFKVPSRMATDKGLDVEHNIVKTPDRTFVADVGAVGCNSATRDKVNQWFTEQYETPSSVASSSFHNVHAQVHQAADAPANEVHAQVHQAIEIPDEVGDEVHLMDEMPTDKVHAEIHQVIEIPDDKSEEATIKGRTIDMDSVYTRDTLTESNEEEKNDGKISVMNIEENTHETRPASKAPSVVSVGDSDGSEPVQRKTRRCRKIESSVSSSLSPKSLPTTHENKTDTEESRERPAQGRGCGKLSYLHASALFKRQMSSPGSDDPYTFKSSQRTPKAKSRRGRNSRKAATKAMNSKPMSKCQVVEIKDNETTGENERVTRTRSKAAANPEKEDQKKAGIKTLSTYGKETEIVVFDALQEQNSDLFSSPQDIGETELESQITAPKKKESTSAKTRGLKKAEKPILEEKESKIKEDQLAEEISQAEEYDFVFSQQIRDEAEEYRKMFKKKTKDNPRTNRVSFDKDVIVVEDDQEVSSEAKNENVPKESVTNENNLGQSPAGKGEQEVDDNNKEPCAMKYRDQLENKRKSDPGLTANQKKEIVVPRRQTRSTDVVTDWEKLKEMNRDLQPRTSRKRPVAEITPSKNGRHSKRRKATPDNSDTDVEEIKIMEMNSIGSPKPGDVQPPEVREMLSQTLSTCSSQCQTSDSGKRGNTARYKDTSCSADVSASCIPESSVDSQEELYIDVDGDSNGIEARPRSDVNTSIGESLGFVPVLTQGEEQQEKNPPESDEVIEVVIESDEPRIHEISTTSENISEEAKSVSKETHSTVQSDTKCSPKGMKTSILPQVEEKVTGESVEFDTESKQSDKKTPEKLDANGDIPSEIIHRNSEEIATRTNVELQLFSCAEGKKSNSQENIDKSQEERNSARNNDMEPDESKTVQVITLTPVGKLVKRRRSESDSSVDHQLEDRVTLNAVKQKPQKVGRRIIDSQADSSSECEVEQHVKPKRRQKKLALSRAEQRRSTEKEDSSEGSDSEKEIPTRRRSGVRAARGLALLCMSKSPGNKNSVNSVRPSSPKAIDVERINSIDTDGECEITMVEGTPQVHNFTRLGKLFSSQRAENLKTIKESQKSQSQSEDMICDTPDETDFQRISPRKQKVEEESQDDREDYVPPTPPKPDRKHNNTYHVSTKDDEPSAVTAAGRCSTSTQGSALDQNSESLIQPKQKPPGQEDKPEEDEDEVSDPETVKCKSQTDKCAESVENGVNPDVIVKEEPPWQIKYSPDGTEIRRAKPTTPGDPVEVEERDLTSELERSKVQDNIAADLALIDSLKKNKIRPDNVETVSVPSTSTSLKPRRILSAVKDELPESYDDDDDDDDDDTLPSLDPKDENTAESDPVEFVDSDSEDDEMDMRKRKSKSRRPVISSDEELESDASVTSSRVHNLTSSSMSDVDTQMIQSKQQVEAEILRMKKELDLMKKQYNEANVANAKETVESDVRESEDQANIETLDPNMVCPESIDKMEESETKSPEQSENLTSEKEPENEHPPSPVQSGNLIAEKEPENEHPPSPVQSENLIAENEHPPSPEQSENLIAEKEPENEHPPSPEQSENLTSEKEPENEHPPSPVQSENLIAEKEPENEHPPSSYELVVQESDPETFTTPTKITSSQRSRLSLSIRKKRRMSSSSYPASPPTCASTPKDVGTSATASQNTPIRSPSPPPDSNRNPETCEAETVRTSSVVASTNALLSKYKTATPKSEEEKQVESVKKRLLEDQNDSSADLPKRPRLQNQKEKEIFGRLSSIDQVSPAFGSLKSSHSRCSLSPASVSSANLSVGNISMVDLPQKPNWCITISGVKRNKDKKLIKTFCSSLGCSLVEKFSPKVTHVIMKPVDPGKLKCEWTLKYFQGVTAGKWVVSAEWIYDCMREGALLPEDKYEINGDTNNLKPTHAARKARTLNTRLMKHLEVCCWGKFVNLPRDELHDLLDCMGARVVQEPSMFTYDEGLEQIIMVDSTNPEFSQKRVIKEAQRRSAQVVEKNWMLNCIGSYEVKDVGEYYPA